MSKLAFTPEQVVQLSKNPNVIKVTEKSVRYTVEFKKHFYNERESGKEPVEIFSEAGFDPAILGMKRIISFSNRITYDSERPEGFSDLRRGNSGRPRKEELSKSEVKVISKYKERMRHQQGMAFKRMSSTNLKAVQKTRIV